MTPHTRSPDPRDTGQTWSQRPGGAIMIHGQPNIPRKPRDYYSNVDWTEGCIALSNSDMVEIWQPTWNQSGTRGIVMTYARPGAAEEGAGSRRR